jgi:pimeloyl-ACP methyl ester carboxylesterase
MKDANAISTEVHAGVVPVDGAEIYYERRGTGPALLLISGGGGDAGFYRPIAGLLADEFTVLTYDIRGNSRSRLTGPAAPLDMSQRSTDALAVMAANGVRSALVFGSSSGAVMALDLAAHHPESVVGTIVHEPPVINVLPDAATYVSIFDEIERIREREGVWPAYVRFIGQVIRVDPPAIVRHRAGRWLAAWALRAAARLPSPRSKAEPTPRANQRETTRRILRNTAFFVTYEMRPIVDYVPDLDALRAGGVPLVVAGGHDSRSFFYCRAGAVLAERLAAEFVEFPGGHAAYFEDPPPFAVTLRETLGRLRARAATRP